MKKIKMIALVAILGLSSTAMLYGMGEYEKYVLEKFAEYGFKKTGDEKQDRKNRALAVLADLTVYKPGEQFEDFTQNIFESLKLDPRGKQLQKILVAEINKNPASEVLLSISGLQDFAKMASELLPNNYMGIRIALITLARIYKAARQLKEQQDISGSEEITINIENLMQQISAWTDYEPDQQPKYKRIASQALAQFNQKNIVVEQDKENKDKFIAKTTTMMPKHQWFK